MVTGVESEQLPEGPPSAEPTAPETTEPETTEPDSTPPRRRSVGWGVLVPVVTAAAGLMFAMSFQAAQGEDLRADRDLPALIIEGNARNGQKAKQLDALQHQVDNLTKANSPKDAGIATLTRQAEEVAVAAAATPVKGPTLEVVLDDSDRSLDSFAGNVSADDIVVHQQDVQAVVNALWSSGAEAMMIQDQRVISTSAVRCVGNTLILQGRVYAPPYRITAMGDIDAMRGALDSDPTIRLYKEYVEAVGLGYAVHANGSQEFPAYSGSVDFAHAAAIR